jgi:hypothetical protein
MGEEIRFQAIPEDCELLARARQDVEVDSWMEFSFETHVREMPPGWKPLSPEHAYVIAALSELVASHLGLLDRSLHTDRSFDKIVYLLSPARRAGNLDHDDSLIYKAMYGVERLNPNSRGTRNYVRFSPVSDVHAITAYLDTITYEILREYYNPDHMEQIGVYKMWHGYYEEEVQRAWESFNEITAFYRKASAHNEAVISRIV